MFLLLPLPSGACYAAKQLFGSGKHWKVCSEVVWSPATSERDEPLWTPKWAQPARPAATPQRSRRRTRNIKAQPQSSLEKQPLERPDAYGLAPGWETPATVVGPEDWPAEPTPDADPQSPEELPSLPLASYPEEPQELIPPETLSGTRYL
ncbi:hypothetical protein UY3_06510 [Chelonia mydas]|uniref:Uncharacterized protein n=1 Tax=Chelonia mydas TaxID=8469 RepID=M7BKP6_CHEMY|nr:hypothetical protein UY3_06510 [Chelonia mydas]